MLLGKLLGRLGYEVVYGCNGWEAVDVFQRTLAAEQEERERLFCVLMVRPQWVSHSRRPSSVPAARSGAAQLISCARSVCRARLFQRALLAVSRSHRAAAVPRNISQHPCQGLQAERQHIG